MERVYIVRHDNSWEYDSGYDRAFTDWSEAAKLRDFLNQRDGGNKIGGMWHVDEEVIYATAQEAIDEWKAGVDA